METAWDEGGLSPPPPAGAVTKTLSSSQGNTVEDLGRMFMRYVRQSQVERRDIAQWWQLEHEGGASDDVRREAAENVKESEGKRMETEVQLKKAIAVMTRSGSTTHNTDTPLSKQLQHDNEQLHIQIEELTTQVQNLKQQDQIQNIGRREAALAREQARAALAESQLAELTEKMNKTPLPKGYVKLSHEHERHTFERAVTASDDVLENRVGKLEWDLNEAVKMVTKLKKKLNESENKCRSLTIEKDALSRELSERMDQLEGEALVLQTLARERARSRSRSRSRSRGRSASPASRRGSNPQRFPSTGRTSAQSRVFPTEPSTAKLGLEVADSMHVNRLGTEVRYDGVRVVSSKRPSAPAITDGDVIVKIDDTSVSNLASFKKAVHLLEPDVSVQFTVRRRGQGGTTYLRTIDVRPRRSPSSQIGRATGPNNVFLKENGVRNAQRYSSRMPEHLGNGFQRNFTDLTTDNYLDAAWAVPDSPPQASVTRI
eukprot:TRINITY_DN3685_c2_g1_i1.p1 TRINITY_DN3685_c2_g1~~TRINITY_DN3685_c2_g1_i1.p1  ORF type:complete len:503 (+),score=100.31 TRINITY_DN3685_c2_g1_i1:51-1511(+)